MKSLASVGLIPHGRFWLDSDRVQSARRKGPCAPPNPEQSQIFPSGCMCLYVVCFRS